MSGLSTLHKTGRVLSCTLPPPPSRLFVEKV